MAGNGRNTGYYLVGSVRRGGMHLLVVVLGADDQQAQLEGAEQLLDYGFAQYETRLLYDANTAATRVKVRLGAVSGLPIGPGRDLYVTLPKGTFDRLQANLVVKDNQFAPVKAGEWMGDLTLRYGDTVLGEYPVVALKSVAEGSWWQKLVERVRGT